MADIKRRGSARWTGDLKTGRGTASTGSGALRDIGMSFATRFEQAPGSNPEELIAAAHASCFSMALSLQLAQRGHPPDELRTEATVTLSKTDAGFKISAVHLDLTGKVPGMDAATFLEAANAAKEGCPVSVLLKPGLDSLTLDARLA